MIRGFVDNSLQARAPLSILDKDAKTTSLNAVVDTGFNGDLCVSIYEAANIHLTFLKTTKFELGNGKTVKQKVYLGTVVFDSRVIAVEVIVSTSRDTIVGASLLADKKLDIDYPRRSVVIKSSKPRKKK